MNKITNLIANNSDDYDYDGESTGLAIGIIIVIIIIFIAFIALYIVGILFALKTQDVEVRKGMFFVHLLIFGGFIAAIVYVMTVNGNKIDQKSSYRG